MKNILCLLLYKCLITIVARIAVIVNVVIPNVIVSVKPAETGTKGARETKDVKHRYVRIVLATNVDRVIRIQTSTVMYKLL